MIYTLFKSKPVRLVRSREYGTGGQTCQDGSCQTGGKELVIQLHVHKKELEILKRLNQKKRIKIMHYDRVIFSILNRIGSIKEIISCHLYDS
jgi:hypothetical protein